MKFTTNAILIGGSLAGLAYVANRMKGTKTKNNTSQKKKVIANSQKFGLDRTTKSELGTVGISEANVIGFNASNRMPQPTTSKNVEGVLANLNTAANSVPVSAGNTQADLIEDTLVLQTQFTPKLNVFGSGSTFNFV